MRFIQALHYFSIISFTRSQLFSSVRIEPELTHLWLLNGSSLTLDCIYTRPSSAPDDSVDFYYNGQIISVDNSFGFALSTKKQMSADHVTETLTLKKNSTRLTNGGEYACRTSEGIMDSRINVHIFRVTLEGDILDETKSKLNLRCEPEAIDPTTEIEIKWSHNNKSIASSDKYNLHGDFTNSSLQILNPERSDMGEYDCEIAFYPGVWEEQRIAPQQTRVLAPPAIDQYSEDKVFAAERNLTLFCKVSGYPLPNIAWVSHDGVVISNSTKFQLLEYGDLPTSQLYIISIESKDKGAYTCKAWTEAFPNHTASAEIRVDDAVPLSMEIAVENGVAKGKSWIEIRCGASGFPRPTVKWFKNGAPVKSSNDLRVYVYESFLFGRVTIWPLQPSDDGDYQCVAVSPASSSANRPSKTAMIVSGVVVIRDTTTKNSSYNLKQSVALIVLTAVFTAAVAFFIVF